MTPTAEAPALSARAEVALAGYRRLMRRRVLLLGLLACAALAAFALDLASGPSGLGLQDATRALFQPEATPRATLVIVRDLRLPQALMAVMVGMALALAGAEMQTVLNNPLASPLTLGTSSAAVFGAALAIVAGIGLPGVPAAWIISANAFVFAFASVLLIQALARLRGAGSESVVLFGIALFFSFNALVGLLQFIASEQALQQLVFWTLGSLGRARLDTVALVAAVVAATAPFSLRAAWRLTALRLGAERAESFGIPVARLRLWSLVRISLLTAAAVAFVGIIGFVGLVAPHMARLMVGEDHRLFLPASALTGALVLSLAAAASKLAVPGAVLPVGIVTALIGVPVFLILVLGVRGRS
ncbi:iron ABC transporter permease [Aquabacter sp. L1I39]|uniref:FecCD family ABC transporter permease n=1 Tax=Aquabacter sp. L1I39 TaxID=2820278 RepID=UPI001ADCB539|nr:iron ABC transporter permease [Aquabacter sp. L1I39]QTL05689.1 iron ABC transporter permease [Aquabacter sp. L1I39]